MAPLAATPRFLARAAMERASQSQPEGEPDMNRFVLPARAATSSLDRRNRLNPRPLSLMLVAALLAGRAYGTPGGELDATFGDHGRKVIQVANTYYGFSAAVSRQPADGKLLFPGVHSWGIAGSDIAVLRLNSDGSTDDTFGANGTATVYLGKDATATKLAVQPDGKIIVAGSVLNGATFRDFALVRLNADGSIDSAFGNHGLVTLDLGGTNDSITDISLLENGQIVVVGTIDGSGVQGAAFARFEMNGSLDTSFGIGTIPGTTVVGATVYGVTGDDEPFAMIRQSDGKFVACGTNVAINNGVDYLADMLAIRVNANGSVDAAFGANGVSLVHTGGGGRSCAEMPDNRLILVGAQGGPEMGAPALARLMPDGTLDKTFGVRGVATFTVGHAAWGDAIIILGDGNLAVSGATLPLQSTNEPTDMFVARVDPASGSLDSTFGDNGITIITFGQDGVSSMIGGSSLIEQADRKLIAIGEGGYSGPVLGLARIDPAGSGSAGFAGFISTSEVVAAGSASLIVTVRRTGGSKGSLSVDFKTNDGTATAPADFAAVNGTLVWQDGDMAPKTITVPITRGASSKGTVGFTIVLTKSTGGLAASESAVEITDSGSVVQGSGGNASSGGGGSLGIGELTALAIISAFATCRRRRSGLTGALLSR
jgi:uncharacterized delta-60 repeat protein